MEINLISFIPLISNVKNMYNTKSSLKYFIVHVLIFCTEIEHNANDTAV